MDAITVANIVLRDVSGPGECEVGNSYNGKLGARISSIFVILVGSTVGAWFPVYLQRRVRSRLMDYLFFFAKYFGSGVIIATAFIHLLAPANGALSNPCLTGPITEYSWPEGIALMTIFVLFFLEVLTMRYASFGHSHDHDEKKEVLPASSHQGGVITTVPLKQTPGEDDLMPQEASGSTPIIYPSHVRGEDHLGHSREHVPHEDMNGDLEAHGFHDAESYAAQMTAVFILEFGVIFHSIFIGLTLAVAGTEFVSLYVVLVFHQTFEGLGLGTRLAAAPWPSSKRWTPYVLAIAYGVSTPMAIAIGLGVRNTYPPGSQTTLIVNGIFDSVSAGILIYTGLVELMAHEFMFSPTMRKASIKTVLAAYGYMCLGAGLMALLGKWA